MADAPNASKPDYGRRATDATGPDDDDRKSAAVRHAIRSELAVDAPAEDARVAKRSSEQSVVELQHVSLAFDVPIVSEVVRGIRDITSHQIERARAGGNVIRLVASLERIATGVALIVEPRELDANDLFANVRDENNAIVIRGRAAGEIVLSGKGAGAMPTASAVLADVIDVAFSAKTSELSLLSS